MRRDIGTISLNWWAVVAFGPLLQGRSGDIVSLRRYSNAMFNENNIFQALYRPRPSALKAFGPIFFAFSLAAVVLPPQKVHAEFTLIDRADAWFFYMQRGVGRAYAACQVVSCERGRCAPNSSSRTQFSLYDARDGHGVMPEFVSPKRVAPGESAILAVRGQRYELVNRLSSPQYYLQAENGETAQAIVRALVDLESEERLGKFTVTAPSGREYPFTVRGVTESLVRMNRRCTRRY